MTRLYGPSAEISGAFQAKLLRVLQDRTARPLGSARSRRVGVRIVVATHRQLPREIRRSRFREDLYYRLAVLPIRILRFGSARAT